MHRRNSSRFKTVLSSSITLIIVLVIFLFLGRAAWTMAERAQVSTERLDQAQAQLAKLQQNQADLSTKVAALSSQSGVVADMREKYHAVEPGESVAVIVGSQQSAAADASQSSDQTGLPVTPENWWHRFLDFIGLRD